MKIIQNLLILTLLIQSCKENSAISSVNPVNWDKRTIQSGLPDSLVYGTSYLSVYSQIYSYSEHRTHNLTVTVSMRNVNKADTVYLRKAEYFDTKGKSIRTYFEKTIFIEPMETVEIVIAEHDQEGGTGANFIFDWAIKPNSHEPFFEGVMISTSGQQGISFTTQGQKVNTYGN
ncbi:MAG: DUF3124 domain-containing protein [Bacteroidia bacterium]